MDNSTDLFPVSEVIGRKSVYCISIFFYFIFTLPSCLAPNIATMLAGRMVSYNLRSLQSLLMKVIRSPVLPLRLP